MSSPYFTLPPFRYERPSTLREALGILKQNGEDARVMAGGVGLLNFMKERLVEAKVVVDIKGIPELRRLKYDGRLEVGATVTLTELLDYPPLKRRYFALYEAVRGLSDSNLRNRSTLVGDLCEAIPWVDSPPPLIAFGATVNIAGPEGARSVPVESFVRGMAQVDLAPDEVVTSVSVPAPPPDSKSRYYKFARGREFGIVNLAVLASGIGSKRTLRLVYGGIGATPVRAREAEDAFVKGGPVSEAVQDVLAAVRRTVEPQSDGLGSAEYRMHLIEVMTARALRDVVGGA